MYSIVWVFVFILYKLLTMFNKKVLVYSWFVLLKGRLCGYPRFRSCRGSVILVYWKMWTHFGAFSSQL